eukprot:784840-Rhodomonas_salina.1
MDCAAPASVAPASEAPPPPVLASATTTRYLSTAHRTAHAWAHVSSALHTATHTRGRVAYAKAADVRTD